FVGRNVSWVELSRPSPTPAAAAAMAIAKRKKSTPVNCSGFGPNRQKAMKFRFAALSMSSTLMSTMIALRRVQAPARPIANRSAASKTYPVNGVMKFEELSGKWWSYRVLFQRFWVGGKDHGAD